MTAISCEHLIYQLCGNAVGNAVEGRIYPAFPTQDAVLPLVVYYKTDATDIATHLGGSAQLFHFLFTTEVWSLTEAEAVLLDRDLRLTIHLYRSRPDGIKGTFLVSSQQLQEQRGYSIQTTYETFMTIS